MSLADMLFATACVSCRARVGSGGDFAGVLCPGCARSLPPPPVVPLPTGLDAVAALTAYRGVGRDLVVTLKFGGRHAAAPSLARALGPSVVAFGVDMVTWAPTSRARRRARGFDQAEILARHLAATLGVPALRTLVRSPGAPQTGRSRADRLGGPRFDARRGSARAVRGRHVLVVDDVITTGATMTAAARVLRAAGAVSVSGAAVAHTPDR